jgi:type IV fimbrial biogenesis protein FimT
MRAMKYRSRGFTLMELMIVLALAAVILALGAPSFNEFRRNNRLTGIANDFLGAIQTARTEAIKRQVPVAVCPSDDGSSCTTGTFRGWVAFVDTDNNCTRDTTGTPPVEPLVRVETRIDSDAAKPIYEVSKGVCISFGSNGFRQNIGGKATADRTIFCDTRGNSTQAGTDQSAARGIEVTTTGRARVTRVVSDLNTWSLTCPP